MNRMFRRKSNAQKQAAAASRAAANSAEGASSNSLAGCPLSESVYAKATAYVPKRSSRIHRTLDKIALHRPSYTAFEAHLALKKCAHLLQLYLKLAQYRHVYDKKTPEERIQLLAGLQPCTEQLDAYAVAHPDQFQEATLRKVKSVIDKGLSSSKPVKPDFFTPLKDQLGQHLSNAYVPGFLQSDQFGKYCISLLTADSARAEDVLYDEYAMMGLMQFMDEQGANLVIQFWLLADNFVSNFDSSPESQRKEDVMGIYNRFISLQAPEPLGIDEKARTLTEARICQEGGVAKDCLAAAQHICFTAIRLYYFPRFKQSELFYKLLDDYMQLHSDPTPAEDGEAGSEVDPDTELDSMDTEDQSRFSHDPTMLGQMTEWGVFLRDAEVAKEPSMRLDQARIPVASRMQKAFGRGRSMREELDMALQVSKMIIIELLREMEARGTLYMSPALSVDTPATLEEPASAASSTA
eukprot:TRINITY_DN7577_c0_g2_i4.p1 TRINITY_DN7577_c0_g2~~TRINITY_DN7577_c0_g2_i4.p1  ORF type:complete len:466 (+),score=111.24 TRINITY_DN7577_c0_g2_i4:103-1500(+)